jgi:hypothetical protein
VHRRLPWLLAVPLMAAGSTAAHTASYVIAPVHQTEAGAEAAERAADGLSARTTLVFGLVAVAAAAAVGTGSRAAAKFGHRRRPGMSPWWFFALPPAAFTCQELAERLLHVESSPFSAALEPRFFVGLAWQLPFSALAWIVARLLLGCATRLVLALGHRPGTPGAPGRRRSRLRDQHRGGGLVATQTARHDSHVVAGHDVRPKSMQFNLPLLPRTCEPPRAQAT